tara:strand:+ start:366 stop:635 length:270 start_codon:yes stop_codon:yes gene_type:complete
VESKEDHSKRPPSAEFSNQKKQKNDCYNDPQQKVIPHREGNLFIFRDLREMVVALDILSLIHSLVTHCREDLSSSLCEEVYRDPLARMG